MLSFLFIPVHAETPEITPEIEVVIKGQVNIEKVIESYDWPVEEARQIAMCESNLNPLAHNPEDHKGCSGSIGVFQVACVHGHSRQDLEDPRYNIQVAYELWQREGWTPWRNCSKNI